MSPKFFSALREARSPRTFDLQTKSAGLSWPGAVVARGWNSWAGPNRAAGWDMEAVIAEGYERSVWTYRCVELISGSQSRLPFRVGRNVGLENEEVIENHPLYRVLNRQANPLETARQFRKRLSAQVLLSKKGAFVEVTKSRAGIITRLDLLDPDRVEIMPSDSGDYIDYFQFTRRDGQVREIPTERIRWVREPHPTDPFCGTTPLEAAGISIELDQLSRMYNISFIKNDSRPGGILSVDTNTLTDQEMARLESRFVPGAQQAGQLSVVASGAGGLNYVDLATRPRDMAYGEASRNSKDEILSAFGIGESVLGNASGRTYDNADAEEYNFWTKPMPPHNDLIAGAFAADLDEDLEPYLDTSGVDALELGKRKRREEARSEVDAGLRSIDEYRPLAQLDPLNNPQSRAVWVSPGKAPIPGSPADAAELLGGEAAPGAAPDPGTDPGAGSGPDGSPADGGEPKTAAAVVDELRAGEGDPADLSVPTGQAAAVVDRIRNEQETIPEPGAAAAAVAAARDDARDWTPENAATLPAPEPEPGPGPAAAAVEAAKWGFEAKALSTTSAAFEYSPSPHMSEAAALALNATLTAILTRQEGVILARLDSPKARKGTPFWRPEHKADTRAGQEPMDIEKAVGTERWLEEAAETLSPVLWDVASQAGAQFLTALIASGVIPEDESNPDQAVPEVTRRVMLAVLMVIIDALNDFLTRLIGALNVAQMTATDVSELAAVTRAHFAGKDGQTRWARALSGDVGHGLVTGMTESVAAALTPSALSRPITREWVSRRDERVRLSHQAVDGTSLPAGEPFDVGADKMMHPQDPTASLHERAGCRCRCVYRIAPGATYTLEG